MSLSLGYINEFNQETGAGLIHEATTKQILSFHLNDIKPRSRRYFTENNDFVGELFEFEIINDEAKNIRHQVLYCPIEGCSRLKAFTNKKALDDHVNIRHIQKEEKRSAAAITTVVVEQPKKERRVRVKPKVISLSYNTSDAVIGRFIGKQGVNIKRIEQQHQVKIQILDRQRQFQSIQIRIKSISNATINMEAIVKQLTVDWERCINFQKLHEQVAAQRWLTRSMTRQKNDIPSIEIDRDARHESHFNFLETDRSKKQKHMRQLKQHGLLHSHKPEKCRKDMKNHQWRVNEQLLDLA